MTSNCDNHFAVNEVIRLRTRGQGSDSEWVQFRKFAEDKETENSYRRMLGIILAKADQHRERESNNNVINTGGGGLHIKCDAGETGSKSKPKHQRVVNPESPRDKNCCGSDVRNLRIREPDRIITNRSSRKHNPGVDQVKKTKVQNCRKRKGKSADVKAKSSDETDDDMEILEDNMEEDADFRHLGRSNSSKNASDSFRKEVLDVLGQPFDINELKWLREAVRDGSYYNYYPDLERKLKRCRYERGKCLNILRGLFFWLQNVCRDGAFEPWKDSQCLAVEPPFSKSSPPPPSSARMDRA